MRGRQPAPGMIKVMTCSPISMRIVILEISR